MQPGSGRPSDAARASAPGGERAPRGDRTAHGDRTGATERVALETILRGRQEIIIEHRNEEYRLRITSNGKLLLTK